MKTQPLFILMLFHVILAIICIYFILSGRTSLRKEQLIPVLILPFFGPFLAVVIEWLNVSGKQGGETLEMEPDPDEDILWKALKSYHENGNIVPLEEAILINDVRTRRKFMLETLYEDPLKYLDILMLAKNNEDVETSHYATATISRAQREFQVAIQDLANAVERHPNDPDLLDHYVETLENYIESGLLEEHLLKNMRIVYKEVLDKKLASIKNDKKTLIRRLRNSMELCDYGSAFETRDLLIKYWPGDEQTWIEAMRVCVEGKDSDQLQEILEHISEINIDWTKQGKEQVSAWMEGVAA